MAAITQVRILVTAFFFLTYNMYKFKKDHLHTKDFFFFFFFFFFADSSSMVFHPGLFLLICSNQIFQSLDFNVDTTGIRQ